MRFLSITQEHSLAEYERLYNAFNDGAFAFQQEKGLVCLAIPINNKNNDNVTGINASGIGIVDYAIFQWDEYESLNDILRQKIVLEYTRMIRQLYIYSIGTFVNKYSEQNLRTVTSAYKNSIGYYIFNLNYVYEDIQRNLGFIKLYHDLGNKYHFIEINNQHYCVTNEKSANDIFDIISKECKSFLQSRWNNALNNPNL